MGGLLGCSSCSYDTPDHHRYGQTLTRVSRWQSKKRYSSIMTTLTGRLQREHETLGCMTRIYCSHHHQAADGQLCAACTDLLAYSEKRLEKCPYGENKPTCAKCPVHCYKKAQREQVRTIMRFAGPRMTFRHPIRALQHVADQFRRVKHPMELRKKRSKSASAKVDTDN